MITETDAMAAAVLRRLDAFLAEPDDDLAGLVDAPFPTDAEARALLAEMGVDVTGLADAIRAQVDAVPAPPPPARSRRRRILAGAGLLAGVASILVFVWWRNAEDPPIRASAFARGKAHMAAPADVDAEADAGATNGRKDAGRPPGRSGH